MKIHFIAIGGSVMHNLAIALHLKGYQISGSDDEIYDPSKSNLLKYGLLPKKMGWSENNIHRNLDMIILGMHAKPDNPELKKATNLGLRILSYPEFIALESIGKKRVVVAGSHGKTTTTSMIIHALTDQKINFDYLVGARIKGFDRMVKITNADLIVMEGDEYLSSPLDRRPKILHYKPHVAILTGIAWDHINVFPTFENYVLQFRLFLDSMMEDGIVVYNENDKEVQALVSTSEREDLTFIPYDKVTLNEHNKIISSDDSLYTCGLIGDHNYQNLAAAKIVCEQLGINEALFYTSMSNFTGPDKRLQLKDHKHHLNSFVYLDFAHAPSKVKTTVKAVKKWYPNHTLYAFFELHTYSSLNPKFLQEYRDALDHADEKIVFYDQHTLDMKNMDNLDSNVIKNAFNEEALQVFNKKSDLKNFVGSLKQNDSIFLFMTSGNFMKMEIENILHEI